LTKPEFEKLRHPTAGTRIGVNDDGSLQVPDDPIVVMIEGDGIGRSFDGVPGLSECSRRVIDAAVAKAFGGQRKLVWFDIHAGDVSREIYFPNLTDDELRKLDPVEQRKPYLPDDTLKAFDYYRVGLKGPLTTPIGGGFRSINVGIRQIFKLFACVRPVKFFKGMIAPNVNAHMCDMVIFRENTEDVYSGIEEEGGTGKAAQLIKFINEDLGYKDKMGGILASSGVGIKPISPEGSKNITRLAIQYALANDRKKVSFMHKGNIMKFTEGAFKNWGYELARAEFRDQVICEDEYWILKEYLKDTARDWQTITKALHAEGMAELTTAYVQQVCETLGQSHGPKLDELVMVNDRIADSMFQQIQLRPKEYEVIVSPNLNGDFISDALAAMIGGLGIAPGANIGYKHAMFEATHGTAPKYTAMDKANPGSVMLSGALMLDHLGWKEAGDMVRDGIAETIKESAEAAKSGPGKEMYLTYDLVRQFPGYSAKEGAKATKFTDRIIHHINNTL